MLAVLLEHRAYLKHIEATISMLCTKQIDNAILPYVSSFMQHGCTATYTTQRCTSCFISSVLRRP